MDIQVKPVRQPLQLFAAWEWLILKLISKLHGQGREWVVGDTPCTISILSGAAQRDATAAIDTGQRRGYFNFYLFKKYQQ